MELSKYYSALSEAFRNEYPVILEIPKVKGNQKVAMHPLLYICRLDSTKGLYYSQTPKSDISFAKNGPGFISFDSVKEIDIVRQGNYVEIPFASYIKEKLTPNQQHDFIAENWQRVRLNITSRNRTMHKVVGYFVGLKRIQNIGFKNVYAACLSVIGKDELDAENVIKAKRKPQFSLESIAEYLFEGMSIERIVSKFD